MSISILTKSFFFTLHKFVNLNVCGIIQDWKPLFVTLEIVNEIPFTAIDAFSIKFFLSFELIIKSNKKDLPIFLIKKILPTQSTCPWVIWPDIFFPNFIGF